MAHPLALFARRYHLRENVQKSRRIVFSECKTTTHRIKGRGRRWDGDNAEAMMALACLDDSRMWRTYWTTLNPARN